MDARLIDTSKLPSRHMTEAAARAPQRFRTDVRGLTKGQTARFDGPASCRAEWASRETGTTSGYLWNHAQTADLARDGGLPRPGEAAEKETTDADV